MKNSYEIEGWSFKIKKNKSQVHNFSIFNHVLVVFIPLMEHYL